MMRRVGVLIAILLGVFVVLSAVDRSEYGLEKQLWRLKRQASRVAQDPKVVPDKEFESLKAGYQKLISRYPKANLLPEIYFDLSNIYMLQKDYGTVRKIMEDVMRVRPDNTALAASALFKIGNTYESDKDRATAIKIYREISEKYPMTSIGLNMPMYIANMYMRDQQQRGSELSLKEAAIFYKKVIAQHPKTAISFNASRLLVTCYIGLKDWQSAIDTLAGILMEFGDTKYFSAQRAELYVKTINTLAVTRTMNYDAPIAIYEKFMNEYPQHPFNEYLKKVIEVLKEAKAKKSIPKSQ